MAVSASCAAAAASWAPSPWPAPSCAGRSASARAAAACTSASSVRRSPSSSRASAARSCSSASARSSVSSLAWVSARSPWSTRSSSIRSPASDSSFARVASSSSRRRSCPASAERVSAISARSSSSRSAAWRRRSSRTSSSRASSWASSSTRARISSRPAASSGSVLATALGDRAFELLDLCLGALEHGVKLAGVRAPEGVLDRGDLRAHLLELAEEALVGAVRDRLGEGLHAGAHLLEARRHHALLLGALACGVERSLERLDLRARLAQVGLEPMALLARAALLLELRLERLHLLARALQLDDAGAGLLELRAQALLGLRRVRQVALEQLEQGAGLVDGPARLLALLECVPLAGAAGVLELGAQGLDLGAHLVEHAAGVLQLGAELAALLFELGDAGRRGGGLVAGGLGRPRALSAS